MQVSYEPWLVLLSIVFAIEGAYLGLHLTAQIGTAADPRRRLLLTGAAFSLGVAIWTLHFVGVLADGTPFAAGYLVFPMFLSFALGVLVVGVAVYAVSYGALSAARLIAASCLLAAAFGIVHYTGMTALHAGVRTTIAPAYLAASLLIAFAGGGLAFRLTVGRAGRPSLLIAASAFGLAITAAHYMAAAGTTLAPHPVASAAASALSPDALAIVIAVVAFAVTGLFLLALVPDRAPAESNSLKAEFDARTESVEEMPLSRAGDDADLRRGIYASLGGIGAPPTRIADNLPIERDGVTHFVPVDEVVAVQANAHYTFLYDGKAKLRMELSAATTRHQDARGRGRRRNRRAYFLRALSVGAAAARRHSPH